MDPTACVEWIVSAIEDGRKEDAAAHIGELIVWMNRGGFAPKLEHHTLAFLLSTLADLLKAR
jgi:hypothetical protein